jgi:hypothetical protein
MLATTTSDTHIPHAWNVAVTEILQAGVKEVPGAVPWSFETRRYLAGNASTTASISPARSIESLGWTRAQALETCLRLRTFADDWDASGMEAYDDL